MVLVYFQFLLESTAENVYLGPRWSSNERPIDLLSPQDRTSIGALPLMKSPSHKPFG
jgi:hypothetical protein